MNDETLAGLRARLEQERIALHDELAAMGADASGEELGVELDEGFADSAHATAERGRMLTILERLRQNLRDVEKAFARIEAGTYGTCERCGKEIPPERLEAIPHARLCLECKQREGR